MIVTHDSSTATNTTPEIAPRFLSNTRTQHSTGGRSRRRRHMTKITDSKDTANTTSNSNDSLTNEKENYHDCSENYDGCTRKLTKANNSSKTHKNRVDICTTCSKEFRRSLKKVSSHSNLWTDFPDLLDTLIHASISGSNYTDSLCLDENISELLTLCTKLIKDVTEAGKNKITTTGVTTTSKRKDVSIEDNLFVAVHILRSVAFISGNAMNVEKKETLLKLLYHLIATCTVTTDRLHSKKNGSSSSSSSSLAFRRKELIALAGYEGLKKVLSYYSVKQNVGERRRVVSFDFDNCATTDEKICFVIPSFKSVNSKSKETVLSLCGNMNVRQISTIAIKTTIQVVTIILHFYHESEKLCISQGGDLYLQSYGSIVSTVLDEKNRPHLHQVAFELLQRVYRPWIQFLGSASIFEKEAAKEVLSYSKGVHRLLWDAASILQSISPIISPSNTEKKDKVGAVISECLQLRKFAIIYLLPFTNIPKLDLLIRKTSSESAFTYAWKAAAVFFQHLSSISSKSPVSSNPKGLNQSLSNFYTDLDSVFSRLLPKDSFVPLGAVEYISYRYLYGVPEIHHFISIPDFKKTAIEEDELMNGNYRVILKIFELGICSKTRIEEFTRTSKGHQEQELKKIATEGEVRIDDTKISTIHSLSILFDEQVTKRLDRLADGIQSRILKILCNLSMHKILFTAIKCDSSVSIKLIETELLVGASILWECLGPYLSAMIDRCPAKASQLNDLIVECFLRPLLLFEHLSVVHKTEGNDSDVQRCMNLSNRICNNITMILIDRSRSKGLSLQITNIEKVAKSIYLIARQRDERSMTEDAILPLLYSLKLYFSIDAKGNNNKDYQLAHRLYLLSSMFQKLNKVNESFFVSCLMLKYESRSFGANSLVVKETDMINCFGEKSYGLLPPLTGDVITLSKMSKSLCRKMATDFIQLDKRNFCGSDQVHINDFTFPFAVESLISGLSDSTVSLHTNPHPLNSIHLLLGFDETMDNGEVCMNIFSATEILRQVGQLIQNRPCDLSSGQSNLESPLNNYFYLYRSIVNSLDNLTFACPLVGKGLLGLITATGIVPCINIGKSSSSFRVKDGADTILIDAAVDIIRSSLSELEKQNEFQEEVLCLCDSLRITLEFFLIILKQKAEEQTSQYDNLLSDCVRVSKKIVSMENFDDALSRAKYWTIWTIVNLQNKLEIAGDRDKATVLSLWALTLAEKIDPYQPWFHSSMVTACVGENNLIRLKNSNTSSTYEECLLSGSSTWIFEKEFQLCQLRIETFKCGVNSQDRYQSLMQKVNNIRTELDSCIIGENNELFVIHTWVLSTVYLLKSDIALAFGCYSIALKTTLTCQKYCQKLIRRASYNLVNHDNWMLAIATSTAFARASQRYIHTLSLRPKLHYRMGDHRKAHAYMNSILEYSNIDPMSLTSNWGNGIALQDVTNFIKRAPQIRFFLEMKSWASTPHMIMEEFSNILPINLKYQYPQQANQSKSVIVQSIQDLIFVGDIMYGESVPIGFRESFNSFYEEAIVLMAAESSNIIKENSLMVPLKVERNLGMPVVQQVRLRDVRRLLDTSLEMSKESIETISDLCAQIGESESTCSEDKAWSLYYQGLLELNHARRSGALQKMWDEHECDNNLTCSVCDNKSIEAARNYLSRSSFYATKSSDIFMRNILRSLALAEGPKMKHGIGMSAGILTLKSIGQSIRRRLALSFGKIEEAAAVGEGKDLQDIFNIFNGPCISDPERDVKITLFLNDLAARTPKNWQFFAPVLCPSGEILVAILKREEVDSNDFTLSTVCIFQSQEQCAYDDIMKPLDDILIRVQEQLHDVNQPASCKDSDKEAMKRQWWEKRNELDDELRILLENVESLYFSNIFNCSSTDNRSDFLFSTGEFDGFPCGKLASRFDAIANGTDDDNDHDGDIDREYEKKRKYLNSLTVSKLKDRLLEAGAAKEQFRKLRKMELITLLTEIEQEQKQESYNESVGETGELIDHELDESDKCIFLILDENLHRFPFEGMPILKGKTVCRLPCLSFVLATLHEYSFDSKSIPFVDPSRVSYVLDPENNLQATQNRILPAIESISSFQNWNGVVGKIPPSSLFLQGLSKKNGLIMYFGHGGAQVCLSRRRVEELIDSRVSSRLDKAETKSSCNATVLLMGCSSGRLISINRKNSNSLEETPLYYEPEGIALSYLCAGAPCVVGNLWDVTDNDIDRFSVSLLNKFFEKKCIDGKELCHQQNNMNLAQSVSASRSACKLQYLVGCAPVCYGVPVFVGSFST